MADRGRCYASTLLGMWVLVATRSDRVRLNVYRTFVDLRHGSLSGSRAPQPSWSTSNGSSAVRPGSTVATPIPTAAIDTLRARRPAICVATGYMAGTTVRRPRPGRRRRWGETVTAWKGCPGRGGGVNPRYASLLVAVLMLAGCGPSVRYAYPPRERRGEGLNRPVHQREAAGAVTC